MTERKHIGEATDEQWQSLIDAIILYSVKRYRLLRNKIRRGKFLSQTEQEELKEIEEFFISSWFAFLSRLDGSALLAKLQAETKYVPTYLTIN